MTRSERAPDAATLHVACLQCPDSDGTTLVFVQISYANRRMLRTLGAWNEEQVYASFADHHRRGHNVSQWSELDKKVSP